MGAQVAAQAVAAGATLRWLPQGRSAATRERAGDIGLRPAADLRELAGACEILLSVCPPAAALDVAAQVADAGFRGVYVDADAVGPERMAEITDVFEGGAVTVVDGGIAGPPPASPRGPGATSPGTTRPWRASATCSRAPLAPRSSCRGPSHGRPR
ncbi:hypothetical protein Saso_20320 [Streptomyces asoensis]|uniref:6-phosphogluconate dehydrogenase NADP-binding domain-containing protein n=2 Tax=Streptomyces asoensis TaxID=249586 RepID=A0ABQ3RX20_9ACTN|nr:hypothetical protein GCM10010496_12910 [Streptomyces asoensis]GHI60382.1 hypothetical protein Saso_20320 [Streptomyces asoensis]